MSDTLYIDESFGSTTYVTIFHADTRRQLSKLVKDADVGSIPTGVDHDCSGKVCARYAKLLRAYRSGNAWVGLVQTQIHRDV
jgi:cupin superfamily acireductone dioxygenase involved in methionine salvage